MFLRIINLFLPSIPQNFMLEISLICFDVLQEIQFLASQNGKFTTLENTGKRALKKGYSFRCEHKIFSVNLKRDPSCREAALRLYCGAPS